MTRREKTTLPLLTTGIPGMDEVLGGGLPQYSFNLVAGVPGAGKTTFVHQLMFANATVERPAIYFTIVGEPALKMLRYQQQMAFFDPEKIGTAIRFVDLSAEVLAGNLDVVLAKMVAEVVATNPSFVTVDSFRTLVHAHAPAGPQAELQGFLQQLALQLTSWQVTSFLIGEYGPSELQNNPVMTIADSIVLLSQNRERNSIVRKLEIMKMRGVASIPGLHTFRISDDGVQVFPRTTFPARRTERPRTIERTAVGIPELDEMLGGGFPVGDATIIAGPSGTGKTMLSTQFIAEGVRNGDGGVLAVFEEQADDYLHRAAQIGIDLESMVAGDKLRVIHLRPLDLSADELVYQIRHAVEEIGAKRLVIDSLNGLEVALAPTFRDDFRESLYRMVGGLTGNGVSVLFTIEVAEAFDEIKFSPHAVSFIAQNILFLRYIEIAGELRKMVTVVKMRRSAHSRDLREYETTATGIQMKQVLRDYTGVLSGMPVPRAVPGALLPGLVASEAALLARLIESGPRTEAELGQPPDAGPGSVARGLQRLLELGYIVVQPARADAASVYEAVARGAGPSAEPRP